MPGPEVGQVLNDSLDASRVDLREVPPELIVRLLRLERLPNV